MADLDLLKNLEEYNANTLNQMATFLGVLPEKQRTKAAVSVAVLTRIQDPNYLRTVWGSLSKGEQALLHAVLRRDGKANLRSLRNELARLGLIDPQANVDFGEYYPNTRPNPAVRESRRLEDILSRLMMRGILFANDPVSNSYGYQTKRTFYDRVTEVFMPAFATAYFPPPEPLPPRQYTVNISETVESSARVFQRDLYLYWGYVRDHPVTTTQRGEIAKAALKEVNAALQVREEIQTGQTENNYPRLRYLRSALEMLNLVQNTRAGNVEAVQTVDFFARDPAERVWQTFETWRETDRYNELLLLPDDVRPKATSNPLIPARPGLVRARKVVLEQFNKLLTENQVEAWIPLQALVDQLYDEKYEFLLKRQVIPGYYGYTVNPYEFSGNDLYITFPGIQREEDGWRRVEAALIRGIITGPLYWQGLVDLGTDASGKPCAFRLTSMGAWVFGQGPQPVVASEGGRVIVQPNLHIIALDPIQDVVLATLDRFAERLSAERAVEYRLTRASVYAAQLAEWDVQRIKTVLEQYSGADLPGNVARTLDEWQAQFERITVRTGVAFAQGAPQVLDRLVVEPGTAKWVTARPLPDLAVLTGPPAIRSVVHALREQGILPVVNTKSEVPSHAVIATETGELHFTTRLPSLYLHGHLVAFADPLEGGAGYQITAESVRRGARSGIGAEEMVSRLEAVHSGPLPEKLVRRIRAWSGHYGSAAVEPVTLLQVQDDKTLEELLADPEIRPLLKRFTPKKTKALARVKPENVEKLKALLSERGLSLNDVLE